MVGTGQRSRRLATFSYSTIEGGNVPPEEVELARRTLDERTFKQEFLASFETFSGRVFLDFDDPNVADRWPTWVVNPVLVGLDFNVGIMAGVICSKVGDTLHQWDEIAVKNSNTDEVAQMLRQRFPTAESLLTPTRQAKPSQDLKGRHDRPRHLAQARQGRRSQEPLVRQRQAQHSNWLICNAEANVASLSIRAART